MCCATQTLRVRASKATGENAALVGYYFNEKMPRAPTLCFVRVAGCIIKLMKHHLRDRKFTQGTRITQAAQNPWRRKLSTTDFQLNARTHSPLLLIKPSKVADLISNSLIDKASLEVSNFPRIAHPYRTKQGLRNAIRPICTRYRHGVEAAMEKFNSLMKKHYHSATRQTIPCDCTHRPPSMPLRVPYASHAGFYTPVHPRISQCQLPTLSLVNLSPTC